MGLISVTAQQPADGKTPIEASDVNNQVNTVVDEFNGNIENSNIKSTAAVAFSKLASDAASTWTPTFGGFSADPTVAFARYIQIGKLVFAWYDDTPGTSNATNFTMTLPVAAKSPFVAILGKTFDNSAAKTTPGRLVASAGTANITLYSNAGTGTWTNSGTKGAAFSIMYEAA